MATETDNLTAPIEIPALTIGIPADRDVDWSARILSRLYKPSVRIEVKVSRWTEKPFTSQDLQLLNRYFPTQEVLSMTRHAPAMRNAIIHSTQSSHILFLDDDMVPESDLLQNALDLIRHDPDCVYQGIPYRVANSEKWLARSEGKLYERGYKKYVRSDDRVTLLDARLMLAPVGTLKETPFDESLVFGGGEGRELAKSLREKGVALRLGRELNAAHVNRDTLAAIVAQKLAHGRGRGYQLLQDGPGDTGWLTYIAGYTKRHFLEPASDMVKGELDTEDLIYIWGTNAIFWAGVLEEMVRLSVKPKIRD